MKQEKMNKARMNKGRMNNPFAWQSSNTTAGDQ